MSWGKILKENNRVIELTDGRDIELTNIAQYDKVTGAILPSGLQVSSKGTWKLIDHYLVQVER